LPSAPHTRLRDRWISAVLRHHRWVLVVAVLVTVAAGVLASRLRIDSDIRSLIPADHPVLVNLDRIESSFGSLGSVNVVVKAGTREQRHAYADAVAERLGQLEEIRDVEYRLRGDFFADHALYFLGDAEMEELAERVQAWAHYELCRAEPDVCLEEPDPAAAEALRSFVRAKQDAAHARTRFRDYYERDGIDALVVLAHPRGASSDLDFSLAIAAEMRAAVAEVLARPGAAWTGTDLSVNVVGPYIVKADERVTISGDMVKSGTFGFIGVVLILYLLLRSGRAVFTLLVPLVCGVTWSMAVTQLVLGHLNTLTSLISTVVMGMGIDAGLHFLLRVREEQAGVSDREAIARAFHGLIVPLLVASGTTLGAFAVMAGSGLPAFHEFGVIAGFGVALCLLAMVTVYPAALLLGGIKRVKPRRTAGVAGALLHALVLRRPGLTLAVVAGLTIVFTLGARRVQFESNGRALQSDHTRAAVEGDTRLISDIFQRDIHAGILVVDTLEQARAVLAAARSEPRVTTVAELFGAPDLLPDPAIDLAQAQARRSPRSPRMSPRPRGTASTRVPRATTRATRR
jgi:predicted exporter